MDLERGATFGNCAHSKEVHEVSADYEEDPTCQALYTLPPAADTHGHPRHTRRVPGRESPMVHSVQALRMFAQDTPRAGRGDREQPPNWAGGSLTLSPTV